VLAQLVHGQVINRDPVGRRWVVFDPVQDLLVAQVFIVPNASDADRCRDTMASELLVDRFLALGGSSP